MAHGYKNHRKFHVKRTEHTVATRFGRGRLELSNEDGNIATYAPIVTRIKSPSEHTVNGKHYDMELQMIHIRMSNEMDDETSKQSNKRYAAVSMFFNTDASDQENQLLESL